MFFKRMTYVLPDRLYVFLNYVRNTHSIPNLKHPKTFNEKLQYLKLYNREPRYTAMADKLLMREFVESKVGPGFTVPVLGKWKRFEDIDFDSLPDQFVLKCNHDSGGLCICRSKADFDIEKARARVNRSLKTNYYLQNREWVYKDIEPTVFAEKYIQEGPEDVLWDYKFFCFNGTPKVMYKCKDAAKKREQAFFDMDRNFLDLEMEDPRPSIAPELPPCFEEMKEVATKLSQGVPFLRVDFFFVDGHFYVGELTFFHCGGYSPTKPEHWAVDMGSWIELPKR